MIRSTWVNGTAVDPDDVVEVTAALATELIGVGAAVAFVEPAAAPAEAAPAPVADAAPAASESPAS